jgi:hypothetical protein
MQLAQDGSCPVASSGASDVVLRQHSVAYCGCGLPVLADLTGCKVEMRQNYEGWFGNGHKSKWQALGKRHRKNYEN